MSGGESGGGVCSVRWVSLLRDLVGVDSTMRVLSVDLGCPGIGLMKGGQWAHSLWGDSVAGCSCWYCHVVHRDVDV